MRFRNVTTRQADSPRAALPLDAGSELSWRKELPPALLLGLAPLVMTWVMSLAAADFSLGVDDAVTGYQPHVSDSMRQLFSGRLPLWSHHTLCGMPMYARGMSVTLYPGNIAGHAICLLTGQRDCEVVVSYLLHMFIGTASAWLFLRQQGCAALSAAIGALGFAFSGPFWGFWTNWSAYAYLAGLIPPTLLLVELVAVRRGDLLRILALGLVVGLVTQMADPQLVVKYFLLGAAYCTLRFSWRDQWPTIASIAAAVSIGLAIGLAQCLATAEFVSLSYRGEVVSARDAYRLSLPPWFLAGLANPFFHEVWPTGFGNWHRFVGAGIFVGPLLPFAAAGMFAPGWWRNRVSRALTVLLIAYAAISLGDYFPPNLLSAKIPLLDRMRWPMRWTLELCALGPLVIGLGVDRLCRYLADRLVVSAAFAACGVVLVVQVLGLLQPPEVVPQLWVLGGILVWSALLAALLVLLVRGQATWFLRLGTAWTLLAPLVAIPLAQHNRFCFPDLRRLTRDPVTLPIGEQERVLTLFFIENQRFLEGNANYCFSLPHQFGGRSIYGYIYRLQWQTWRHGVSEQGEIYHIDALRAYLDPAQPGLLRLLRIGAVVTSPQATKIVALFNQHPDLEKMLETQWIVAYRHKGFREPAWFVDQALVTDQTPDSLDLSRAETEKVAICYDPDAREAYVRLYPGRGTVRRFAEDHGRISIEIERKGDGLLVVNTSWYPGWKAFVDGQAVPVFRAYGSFLALPVPDGGRQVELRFQPDWLLATMAFSYACQASALLILVFGLIRRGLHGRHFARLRPQSS